MKVFGAKGVLGLALVLAAGTSFLAYTYLERAGAAPPPAPQTLASTPVVTASKDVPARTVITSDMVKLTQLPASAKLPGAATTLDQVTGKVTRESLVLGEQVQVNHLFPDRQESGLTFVVPPGRRAVSVGVDEVVGSGGLLQPGDFVDVVAVFDLKGSTNQASAKPESSAAAAATPAPAAAVATTTTPADDMVAASQYVVQNVEVLAVAQTIEGLPVEQSLPSRVSGESAKQPGDQGNVQPKAHSVTLSVTAEQAQRLVLAEQEGHIRLVLRPYGDMTVLPGPVDGLISDYRGITLLTNQPKAQQG